jgi:hypothetical protein
LEQSRVLKKVVSFDNLRPMPQIQKDW